MPEKWDAIIVGAGVGGLTAAARLVQGGLKVLVLDRNPHPGGTAFVYTRKNFTFPMGPLGFSTPRIALDALRSFGMADDLTLNPVHYRLRVFGLDVPLSLTFYELTAEYAIIFPGDAQGIERFFFDMEKIAAAMRNMGESGNRQILENAARKSAAEYLANIIRDDRLKCILGSMGSRAPYAGLPLLAAMWNLMCNEGIFYPVGGMRSFVDRLQMAVLCGNGEIRLKTDVTRINVKNGKVVRVTLSDGASIAADAVISNADFKTTFLRLMDKNAIPEKWHKFISDAKQTASNLQVCLGIRTNSVDLGAFEKASRLIYARADYDVGAQQAAPLHVNWDTSKIDPELLAAQEMEINLWSADDPTLAPDNNAVIVIRTEAEHSHFTKFRPAWRRRTPDYFDYKTTLARALVKEASKLIPGLIESVVVMDVATPLTFEEMGGRSGGAVAGWSWDYEDSKGYETREMIRTPIRGLYMAGYQAFSSLFMGGIPTAMESGLMAAEALLRSDPPIGS